MCRCGHRWAGQVSGAVCCNALCCAVLRCVVLRSVVRPARVMLDRNQRKADGLIRDSNGWVGYGKGTPTDETKGKITSSMDRAPVDVVVTLARSKIRTGDLLDLSVGDIITTEKEVTSPLELSVQNVPKYNASAGAFKGKKAVQIKSVIEKNN